ncbi:arsenosugar biosynthesis-associated peroxidase-like protein [Pendulispora rubella]|uniref:Arsenosugar biosynthesis-associated peroxidase-like protein n=1 Tax=Pendulispora rubella TaxID=2741070 RepID=A0ABZ2L8R9_9BACT
MDRTAVEKTLSIFCEWKLLSPSEKAETLSLFDAAFPFAEAMALAESIHLHVKVADTDLLPHERIRALGSEATSCTKGYVKYPFPSGCNMIFSSIPVSEDDMLKDEPPLDFPVLDHTGIDLRRVTAEVRHVFDSVPNVAIGHGWRHRAQGGSGTPVYCCHTEVEAKHWVYPPRPDVVHTRPVEFAIGALVLHDAKMGCDLRPIDPAHPRAAEAMAALSACAASHAAAGDDGAESSHYYARSDLAHFADMGHYAKPLMDKFFAYYNAVTGEDGALTKREKALIALAVAHSKQCPYCIDAYTNTLADMGVSPDEMHEAVHVAAALGAGIDLVHGVQMQNTLKRRKPV